jgi:hypothetical protein
VDAGDNDPERRELELKKLRLEVRQQEADLAERRFKSRYEIRSLWWGWGRYTVTILLALLVPVGGWMVTEWERLQTENVNASQRDEDLYFRILQGFGSPSSAARQGATAALISYAKVGVHGGEHTAETSALLANRLVTETDGSVLDEVIAGVGSLSYTSIPEVVRANRSASLLYARTLGHIVALRLITEGYGHPEQLAPNVSARRGTKAGLPEQRRADDREQALRYMVYAELSGVALPLEHELNEPGFTFDPSSLMQSSRFRTAYRAEFERVLADADLSRKRAATALPRERRRIEDSVRNLAATSTALVRLIRGNTGRLGGRDLRRTVIFNADLRNVDLREADFSDAILAGTASGADFSYATLRGTSLVFLSLVDLYGHRARMHAADVTGATFAMPDNEMPDLTGSYWWRAVRRKNTGDEGSSAPPKPITSLSSAYPKPEAIHACFALRRAAKVPVGVCYDMRG